MKERPIIFSAPMVRAVLEGRKTQTRRVVKPQPASDGVGLSQHPIFGLCAVTREIDGSTRWLACPYGVPGDRLWVRETMTQRPMMGLLGEPTNAIVAAYKADDEDCVEELGFNLAPWWRGKGDLSAIHMPRNRARLLLEITTIRAERLQDISASDAQAEGVKPIPCGACIGGECIRQGPYCEHYMAGHIEAYQRLWNDINGAGSWDANPWVWVVEFRSAA